MPKKAEAQEAEIVGQNPTRKYEKSGSKNKSGSKSKSQNSRAKTANRGQKYRGAGGRKTPPNAAKVIRVNRIIAVLILILIVCIFALLLKFVVGIMGGLLQFIIVAAAIGLVAALIYNFVQERK